MSNPSTLTPETESIRDIITASLIDRGGYVVVPQGYKIEDVEKFYGVPRRLRGNFATTDLEAFVGYVAETSDLDTQVFLDADNLKVIARMDHGSPQAPGWGQHRAVLQLKRTPEYSALLALAGKGLQKQDDLVEWIADWAPSLRFTSGELTAGEEASPLNAMSPTQAILAIRKLTTAASKTATSDVQETGLGRTVLESATVTSDPPRGMVMTVRPYAELPAEAFLVRFVYQPTDPPLIRARIIGLEPQQAAHAQAFARLLMERLTANVPVHVGTFS